MEVIRTFDELLFIPELKVPVYQCGLVFRTTCPLFDPAPDFGHIGEEVINPADYKAMTTASQAVIR